MKLLQTCLLLLSVCTMPAQQSRQTSDPPASQSGRLDRVTPQRELTKTSLSVQGLTHAKALTGLYLGDFGNLPFNRDDTLFQALFEEYLQSFAQECTADLPADKVEMTKAVCDQERYLVNRYGARVGPSSCSHYREEGTGLYADPALYAAKTKLDAIVASNALHEALRYMSQAKGDPAGPAMNILNQIQTAKADTQQLLKLNGCNSSGLKRFQHNLMLFALGKRPVPLSAGGATTGVEPVSPVGGNRQNYKKLLEDLIESQSKTWLFNHYVHGSMSDVSILTVDSAGHPTKVVGHYLFNGTSPGSVTVEFSDGLPECMYFFDLPGTCRTPDHHVVAAFANGSYQN